MPTTAEDDKKKANERTEAEKYEAALREEARQFYAQAYELAHKSRSGWVRHENSPEMMNKEEIAKLSSSTEIKLDYADGVYVHIPPIYLGKLNKEELMIRVAGGKAKPIPFPKTPREYAQGYGSIFNLMKSQGFTKVYLDWGYTSAEHDPHLKTRYRELITELDLAEKRGLAVEYGANKMSYITSMPKNYQDNIAKKMARVAVSALNDIKPIYEKNKERLENAAKWKDEFGATASNALAGTAGVPEKDAFKTAIKDKIDADAGITDKVAAIEKELDKINEHLLSLEHANGKIYDQVATYSKFINSDKHKYAQELDIVEKGLHDTKDARNGLLETSDKAYKEIHIRLEAWKESLEAKHTAVTAMADSPDKAKQKAELEKALDRHKDLSSRLAKQDPSDVNSNIHNAKKRLEDNAKPLFDNIAIKKAELPTGPVNAVGRKVTDAVRRLI